MTVDSKRFGSLLCAVAACLSLAFLYLTGRRNPSVLLLLLFTAWVLSPFLALWLAAARSDGWPPAVRTALQGAIIVISVAAPLIYGVIALGPPRPQPAFFFLVVPFASWCLAVLVVGIAFLTRRKPVRG